ncbi:MAG: 50S ribosomal protein L20 [Candidatus Omnitrophica bacterium]|nr:50S ribosomal protein L20 [Candidatus Omnitrophota bacterium]
MTKVKFKVASKKRRKKVLKKAKGQFGGRSKLYRTAKESVQKGMYYSYRDRKQKKRLFRNLWIVRINAGCKADGLSYSKFMNGLKKAKITLNRKILADLAMNDKKAFSKLTELAKTKK